MSRRAEGVPGDVEPVGGGQQLVGIVAGAEEVDQTLELRRIFRPYVGSLGKKMLGVADAPHLPIVRLVAVA